MLLTKRPRAKLLEPSDEQTGHAPLNFKFPKP